MDVPLCASDEEDLDGGVLPAAPPFIVKAEEEDLARRDIRCDPASPMALLAWTTTVMDKDPDHATRCLCDIFPAVPANLWSPLRVMGLLEKLLLHWPRTAPALVCAVNEDDANAVALVETHGILHMMAGVPESEALSELKHALNGAY